MSTVDTVKALPPFLPPEVYRPALDHLEIFAEDWLLVEILRPQHAGSAITVHAVQPTAAGTRASAVVLLSHGFRGPSMSAVPSASQSRCTVSRSERPSSCAHSPGLRTECMMNAPGLYPTDSPGGREREPRR